MHEGSRDRVRLAGCEVNLSSGELRNGDTTTVLQEQPLQILRLLIERQGRLVSREEIKSKLWPNDTIVEFDQSINAAIRNLRRALADSADEPRYIETFPRRGYRLMVPVIWAPSDEAAEGPGDADRTPAQTASGLIGKKVSHFRVLGALGGGGGGMLYKAEDLQLPRQVALKFLPEELARDPVALQRFEREAQTASSLDHPNICTIYQVDEYEGQPFIVMQLLRGQTLRDRLAELAAAEKKLQLDELLSIAVQICDGLQAAHEQGIIHRDIKPANIFLTSAGQVKILDFGLAKLVSTAEEAPATAPQAGEAAGAPQPARSASLEKSLTQFGVALGTAGYMSPEQIRGEALDARTDIFSFGLVLYEMAAGQRAFAGQTVATLHDAILNATPIPAHQLNATVPPQLEKIIGKALERDRDLRYQRATEIHADLQQLNRDTDSGHFGVRQLAAALASSELARGPLTGAAADRQARPASWPEEKRQQAAALQGEAPALPGALSSTSDSAIIAGLINRHQKAVIGTSILVAAIVCGLAVTWFLLRSRPQPSAELTEKRLTFNSSENPVSNGLISPDGKYLAYEDLAGIHVKVISTGDERLIPKPAGVPAQASWGLTSWFPDGTQLLANTSEPGPGPSAWTVSVLGQSARQLREGVLGFGVSPDGTRVGFVPVAAPGEIWVMDSQGENAQKLLAAGENEEIPAVVWSPDGQRLAFVRATYGGGVSVETCDLKGANRTVVASVVDPGGSLGDIMWLPDRRIVYLQRESDFQTYDLWQVGIDADPGTPVGKPKRITQWTGMADRAGVNAISVSADGKRLVLRKSTNQRQIYLGQLAAGGTRMNPPRRFTHDDAHDYPVAWMADSKAVFFLSDRLDTVSLFKQGITQETAEVVVTATQSIGVHLVLSPEGAWVLYHEIPKQPSSERRLMRVSVNGGVPQFVMDMRVAGVVSGYDCARAPASLCVVWEVSPDEKQVTFTAFDPLQGRGKVLRTIEKDPSAYYFSSSLSPDGSTLAVPGIGAAEARILLFSLSGGADREITVKGWPSLASLEWSPDGKGFYCGSMPPQGNAVLHVDLNGNAQPVWQAKGAGGRVGAVPSPDGRYLAFSQEVTTSNMWMLEGF